MADQPVSVLADRSEQAWCLALATNAVIAWTTEYSVLAVTALIIVATAQTLVGFLLGSARLWSGWRWLRCCIHQRARR